MIIMPGNLMKVQKNCFTRCSPIFSSELPKVQFSREFSYPISSPVPGTSSGTGVGICEFTHKLCFLTQKASFSDTGTVTNPEYYSEQFLESRKLLRSSPNTILNCLQRTGCEQKTQIVRVAKLRLCNAVNMFCSLVFDFFKGLPQEWTVADLEYAIRSHIITGI